MVEDLLNGLKERFSIKLIITSWPIYLNMSIRKPVRRLIEEMFELPHTDEGLPPCKNFMCNWY